MPREPPAVRAHRMVREPRMVQAQQGTQERRRGVLAHAARELRSHPERRRGVLARCAARELRSHPGTGPGAQGPPVARGRLRGVQELGAFRGSLAFRELRTFRGYRATREHRGALELRTARGLPAAQRHCAVRGRHSVRAVRAARGRRGCRNVSRLGRRAHAAERTRKPLRARDRPDVPADLPGAVPRLGHPAPEHQPPRTPASRNRRAGPGPERPGARGPGAGVPGSGCACPASRSADRMR